MTKTNEEAIEQLKHMKLFIGYDAENLMVKRMQSALDMAIKALEQQPSEDYISRKAVLDIIYFEDKWLYDANAHNADTKIAFNGLESRVKELPSVTPKAESEDNE